jgi:hypothetical protein
MGRGRILRREPFRAFLTSRYRGPRSGQPLTDRSADSYCAYASRIEAALRANLDSLDLSGRGLVALKSRLRASQRQAGIPAGTLNNCLSSLRAYGQFVQLGATTPATTIPVRQRQQPPLSPRAPVAAPVSAPRPITRPAYSQIATSAPPASRSFYAATVTDFMDADPAAVLGKLSRHHIDLHAAAEGEQVRAWEAELQILRRAFEAIGGACSAWSILLEVSLLRLGRRLDAVVLSPGVVTVIEFKIGSATYDAHHRVQTERYAQGLRDFHEVAQGHIVVPVLCCERAPSRPIKPVLFDGVANLIETNAEGLGRVLTAVARLAESAVAMCDIAEFEASAYRPTPTIVEAAQALYAGHQIAEIGRGDAADTELQAAADRMKAIALEAEARREKVVCFVTGAPGAGKTLLGLDLALKSRTGSTPAALLSGNRPLVHVLTEALAVDTAARTGVTKAEAKYQADAAIQNLLGYLKEHTDGAVPPEHVIVFDEAQRAWDAEVGQELLGRPKSEPELFLDILDRLDWACLVCLVGPGQEINRGEGGLALWGEALAKANREGQNWRIVAAPQAADGGQDVAGPGLLSGVDAGEIEVERDRHLHLANSKRAYRNALQGKWVALLLEGQIAQAKAVADQMDAAPALLTRDLDTAKTWLRQHRRGGRSVGLLCSSGGVRLVAEGLPPAPRSNELAPIGHWFLKPYTDYRSSGAVEIPMSEFGCQGLELDFTAVCWGGDLIWNEGWVPRDMRAPRWQISRQPERQRFRINGYRVLLTRARAGSVIYVPKGDAEDPTRPPADFDAVAAILEASGCVEV